MWDQIIDRVRELETLFSSNQYDGVGIQPFVIEKGNIPIMLSAPHAINQFKESEVKWADKYTGGIARYLHEVTGCHLIYSCMFTKTDPNYDAPEENEYQDKLKDYVSKNRIMLLLDLHGSSKKREYAVEMGTAPKPNQIHGHEYEEDPSLHNLSLLLKLLKVSSRRNFVH